MIAGFVPARCRLWVPHRAVWVTQVFFAQGEQERERRRCGGGCALYRAGCCKTGRGESRTGSRAFHGGGARDQTEVGMELLRVGLV